MQNFQTLLPVHDVRRAAHGLEVAQQVKTNAGQTGPRCFQTVGLDGEGQVFRFDDAVVAAGKLLLQDGGVLGADVVKIIPLRCDLKTFWVDGLIRDGGLRRAGFTIPLVLADNGINFFFLGAGELFGLFGFAGYRFSGQWPLPPVPFGIAAQGRRKHCWFDRAFPWDG